MKLSVFFDGQFWVGIFEVSEQGKLKAAKIVFGAEPSETEIFQFVNTQMLVFLESSLAFVDAPLIVEKKVNPKRRLREAADYVRNGGVSSHAQLALKFEQERRKEEKKSLKKQKNEESEERKFEIARLKAKEKHKGH